MKKRIKGILGSMGLSGLAKKANRIFRTDKYQNVNEWHLHVGDVNLTYDTSNSYSKRWFYPRYDNGRIHEPVATKLFLKHIHENSQVLDIGSHLGYFSCIAGKLASNGSVNAFEVDPKCLVLINKNLELNGLNNVTVNNFAVSDKNEVIKIPQQEDPNPGLVINSNSRERYIEVESIRIDDFISQKNIKPDFIKIDVEGAEWNVLNGMKYLLKQDDLVMLIEIHADNLRKYFNADYKDCIDILLQNGFTLENIDHRLTESSFKTVDRNTVLKENTMLLCKKTTTNIYSLN